MNIINMQTIRYINLLDKTSKVKTNKCFIYNRTIIFVVPNNYMHKAIGANGKNVRLMRDILGRKIKIIKEVSDISEAHVFIKDIIEPLTFKSIEVVGDEIIINAGGRNKAALIGRNKSRFEEMALIVQSMFGKKLRIV